MRFLGKSLSLNSATDERPLLALHRHTRLFGYVEVRSGQGGTGAEPGSAAAIARNLGYDLFRTKGLEPTWLESLKSAAQNEGTKELVKLVFAFVLAVLLFYAGFKKG